MCLFKEESCTPSVKKINNLEWWNELFDQVISGRGVIFIEEGKGLIMGIVSPIVWCNKTYGLHELAWYVKPEYRKSTVGYRLFKEFVNYGNQLKDEGRITFFVMGKLHNSPNLNYEKYGFKKMEETWIKELS
jgi:hypothetical protein